MRPIVAKKIVERNRPERYYVTAGQEGHTAIELQYDSQRIIFDEQTLKRSLAEAKRYLREYKRVNFGPHMGTLRCEEWALMLPICAETREFEIEQLRNELRQALARGVMPSDWV